MVFTTTEPKSWICPAMGECKSHWKPVDSQQTLDKVLHLLSNSKGNQLAGFNLRWHNLGWSQVVPYVKRQHITFPSHSDLQLHTSGLSLALRGRSKWNPGNKRLKSSKKPIFCRVFYDSLSAIHSAKITNSSLPGYTPPTPNSFFPPPPPRSHSPPHCVSFREDSFSTSKQS